MTTSPTMPSSSSSMLDSLSAKLAGFAYSPTPSPRKSRVKRESSPTPSPTPTKRRRDVNASPFFVKAEPGAEDIAGDVDARLDAEEIGDDPNDSEYADSDQIPERRAVTRRQTRSSRQFISDLVSEDTPSPTPSSPPLVPLTPRAHGWKRPRTYADPITGAYAHLSGLPDYLEPELQVVFIGINPGTRSGQRGHFFAHPTNKFWKALYGSGFTERLYTPDEDKTMIRRRVGLTNLVERVTAQASELSPREQRLAVAPLTAKLAQYAPKVACFVGKGIWDVYYGVAKKAIRPTTGVKSEPESPLRVTTYSLENGQVTPTRRQPTDIKAETTPRSSRRTPKSPKKEFKFDEPQCLRLVSDAGTTYFWVVPNTSGLERTIMSRQIELFTALKRFAVSLEAGETPQGEFVDVHLEDVQRVVDAMRAA